MECIAGCMVVLFSVFGEASTLISVVTVSVNKFIITFPSYPPPHLSFLTVVILTGMM